MEQKPLKAINGLNELKSIDATEYKISELMK